MFVTFIVFLIMALIALVVWFLMRGACRKELAKAGNLVVVPEGFNGLVNVSK